MGLREGRWEKRGMVMVGFKVNFLLLLGILLLILSIY